MFFRFRSINICVESENNYYKWEIRKFLGKAVDCVRRISHTWSQLVNLSGSH